MRDRCIICGAVLSENNTTGIGYECLAALNKAKSAVFFSNEEYAFKYNFLIEADIEAELIRQFVTTIEQMEDLVVEKRLQAYWLKGIEDIDEHPNIKPEFTF